MRYLLLSFLAVALFNSLATGQSPSGTTTNFHLDPKGAYVFTNTTPTPPGLPDNPNPPLIIPLASLGVAPGDVISGSAVGDMNFCATNPTCSETTNVFLCGVFSSSNTLLPSGGTINRVPGAIAPDFTTAFPCNTPSTLFDGLPTEIPEDISFIGEPVTVPKGAAFLFIAVNDSFYSDNADPNGDLAIAITTNNSCSVKIENPYSQLAKQWGGNTYDHTKSTIAVKGCLLTDMTMAINAANGNSAFDPGTLNSQLTDKPGNYAPFDKNGSVNWSGAPAAASNGALKFFGTRIDSKANSSGANAFLDDALCKKHHPVIVAVNGSTGKFGGHFVLVNGKQGSTYSVIDPGSAVDNETTLDTFGRFETRGYVADPIGDLSRLSFVVDDSADLLVRDPSGAQTGIINRESGDDVQTIPQSYHFTDELDDDAPGDGIPIGPTHTVGILQPLQGTFQINVVGLKLSTFQLQISSIAQDGTATPPLTVTGITGPGSTLVFSLNFSSTPGSELSASRVASFPATLADIANSLSLLLIDNGGIANALSQHILAAQSASTRGEKQAALNELHAFQNLVSSQDGKHITGIATQVLQEDASSLANQIQ